MKQIYNLIKRNMMMYVRDGSALFFSILSMLIIIALMILFLGNMNEENIIKLLEKYGGMRDSQLDQSNAHYLIQMWTIAGILPVNAVTVSLTLIGIMVQDSVRHKLQSFYIAPISRVKIALGYIGAAWISSTLLCILTFVVSEIWIVLTGGELLSLTAHLKIVGIIIANAFTFSGIMYLIALFIRSESAYSGLGTIVGTLVGFLGAIYLPMGMLPAAVQNVLKCTPIVHGCAMFRSIFTEAALDTTFQGLPDAVMDGYKKSMGITITVNDTILNMGTQLVFIVVCGMIVLAVAGVITKKRAVSDR